MNASARAIPVADNGRDMPSLYGWLPVAASAELGPETVLPIRLHGDEIVLWRGESGDPHALNAFCAHLGHHLGYGGRVCGEDVRCFYHGWTWSPEGANTDVPYDRRTYKGRRIGRWPVSESGGMIYLWHHGDADRSEPTRPAPDFEPPRTDFVVRAEVDVDSRLVIQQFVDPITLGGFLGRHVVTSVVAPTTDGPLVIRHGLDDGGQVVVEVHDVATVLVRTEDWSLVLGVCPVSAETVRVWSAVTGTGPDAGQFAEPRDRVEHALDRQLDFAARMEFVAQPQGSGAESVESYRHWARALDDPTQT